MTVHSEILSPDSEQYIREWVAFLLVLIRQLFRSLHCPGDGRNETLEIVFEGCQTAQTR